MSVFFLTYLAVELGDEEDAVVDVVTHVLVRRGELDLIWLSSVVVGHLDLGHGIPTVHLEGLSCCFFSLEIDVRHAVDGQQRGNVARRVVLRNGILDEHAANHAELSEHVADFTLGNAVGEALDEQVRFLLVHLAALHAVLLFVRENHEAFPCLAGFHIIREFLIVHLLKHSNKRGQQLKKLVDLPA